MGHLTFERNILLFFFYIDDKWKKSSRKKISGGLLHIHYLENQKQSVWLGHFMSEL